MNIFLKKMMYLLPIPIFIVAVNYIVEKTNLLQNNAREAAHYLLQGYNIANAYTCGDCCIKEFYAKSAAQEKDTLVFGSSRSLGINSKLFPSKTFFNTSVTDGRLENFIYFYFLWREKGLVPSHVILGLDVWLLKGKSQSDLMDVIKDKFMEVDSDFLSTIDSSVFSIFSFSDGPDSHKQIAEKSLEFAQRLVSIDLFRNSLMYVVNVLLHECGFKGIGVFYPTKENFAVSEVMLADGSINYGLVRRSRSVEEVNHQVLAGIKEKGFAHLGNFNRIDAGTAMLFELFIKLLLHDKVSVTFFLTPYHPKAYELLKASEKYKLVCSVRDYFINIAQKNGIKVVGDFDPSINHLEDSDFFDEFHPKESAMQKVFRHDSR